jgi:YidC/Oxa1 family membrane protein insertase
VTTFTGPPSTRTKAKFVKVDFKDIEKGKQAHPKKAKDGWIAMVQHYFVSAWLPRRASSASTSPTASARTSTRPASSCPRARSRRAPRAAFRFPPISAPGNRDAGKDRARA